MVKKSDFNFKELFAEIETDDTLPMVSGNGGSNVLSFGVVNSESNGKRISISKALCEKLGLEKEAQIAIVPSKGVIVVAKELTSKNICKCKLRGERGRKISYNSGLVRTLTETFDLDFSKRTSITFTDIEVQLHDGEIFAIVYMEN